MVLVPRPGIRRMWPYQSVVMEGADQLSLASLVCASVIMNLDASVERESLYQPIAPRIAGQRQK